MRLALPSSKSPHQSGFSLLEVLVVLVIVAMVTTALTQALSQALAVRTKLGPYIDRSEDTARIGEWYRQIVNGTVPADDDLATSFRGNPSEISGLTLAPLAGEVGIPTAYRLAIETEGNDSLVLRAYAEGSPTLALAHWPRSAKALQPFGFQFFDGTDWVARWPLDDATVRAKQPFGRSTGDEPPQLPKLIRVNLMLGTQEIVLVGAPRGPLAPLPNINKLLNRR